jgi:hypothetical protein
VRITRKSGIPATKYPILNHKPSLALAPATCNMVSAEFFVSENDQAGRGAAYADVGVC